MGSGMGINDTWCPDPDELDGPMALGVSAKLVCLAGGASGVLVALTEPVLRLPPDMEASSSNDGGTEANVSVDTDEGLPPRCRALAEAADAGGAVIVTIVLAALFTADVEL